MQYLNLGCGKKYINEPNWLNADMVPLGAGVKKCNFLKGIPFKNENFDVVYHSHVLEHFNQQDGLLFLKECFRILKVNGILRIALPDLEKIINVYQEQINNWKDVDAKEKYKWIMLEMYDQTVRNESGGGMYEYLKNIPPSNKEFIANRIGKDALEYFNIVNNKKRTISQKFEKVLKQPSILFDKIKNIYFRIVLWGKHYDFYKLGAFRNGGEIHQWMYDKYSLKDILIEIGFKKVKVQTATESFIPNWASFNLDGKDENASLFIEAIK